MHPGRLSSLFVSVVLLIEQVDNSQPPAEFIEEPQDQAVLIGENGLFHCKALAHILNWDVNDLTLVWPYDWDNPPQDIKLVDRMLSEVSGTYNMSISMIVRGNLERNNTRIKCLATGGDLLKIASATAIFHVYDPPVPPNISIHFLDGPTTIMVLHFQLPRVWHNIESSFFNITMSNKTDQHTAVLYSGTVPATKHAINLTENEFPFTTCSRYVLSVTSVSALGNSQPNKFSIITPAPPSFDDLPWPAINSSVYFDTNLTPIAMIQAQVSSMCLFLYYTYSIFIEGVSKTHPMIEIGPKQLPDSGLIKESLMSGLDINTEYTYWIEIQSFHPSKMQTSQTQSPEKFFSTVLLTENLPAVCSAPLQTVEKSLQLTTALLGASTGLLLLILIIWMACFFICIYKRSNHRSRKTINPPQGMVTNPIYGSPVYETVHQSYNPLSSSASTTPDSSPTTPLNEHSRYSTNPTSRSDILDMVRRNTLPNNSQSNNRVISPLAGTSYRSASVSGNTTVKHPRRERNKLHLTLSLDQRPTDETLDKGSEGASHSLPRGGGILLEEDENYTVMSPAGSRGFGSSLIGGWGDSELSSKD